MKLNLCLMMLLMVGFALPSNAQDRPNASASQVPLTPDEIREGTLRIEQAILGWETEKLLREAIAKETEFAERERQLASRELAAEKQRTEIAEKETAIQKERADFYEKAFRESTKGRTFGCTVAKIFTVGLARCR